MERFPESCHVREFDLQRAEDRTIWDFAREGGFTIVSKDSDFRQFSFLYGHPPKVVWLSLGNCTTHQVLETLLEQAEALERFELDEEASFVAIS